MKFGERLQGLRKEKGFSQEKVAEELKVSRQSVSKWERGESFPEMDKVIVLSKILGVSTDFLLKGEDEKEDSKDYDHHNGTVTAFGKISDLINRKGYIAGYIVAGYSALVLIFSRVFHFASKSMIMPPEGFGVTFSELPAQLKIPLYIANGISIAAILGIIGGFWLARRLKQN
ncbi:MAG: helix-turn-helix domain-containing protein [Gudongella sp.]|nr:helix-turn-helix domain-containing protein [Gudongella sp.]